MLRGKAKKRQRVMSDGSWGRVEGLLLETRAQEASGQGDNAAGTHVKLTGIWKEQAQEQTPWDT